MEMMTMQQLLRRSARQNTSLLCSSEEVETSTGEEDEDSQLEL